jgi:hypothetical protein
MGFSGARTNERPEIIVRTESEREIRWRWPDMDWTRLAIDDMTDVRYRYCEW